MESFIALLPIIPFAISFFLNEIKQNKQLPIQDMPVVYNLEINNESAFKDKSKNIDDMQGFWQLLSDSTKITAKNIIILPRHQLFALYSTLQNAWQTHLCIQDKEQISIIFPQFEKFISKTLNPKESNQFKQILWKKIHKDQKEFNLCTKKLFPHGFPQTVYDCIKKLGELQESHDTQKILALKQDIQALLTLNQLLDVAANNRLKSKF